MDKLGTNKLKFVVARLAYLGGFEGRAAYRIYPPSSGREPEGPPKEYHEMRIHDCRAISEQLSLDRQGFMVRLHTSANKDFFDDDLVRTHYYPEVEALVKKETGAVAVLVFDHNVRSVERAAQGKMGVRAPVDGVHDDYTEKSGQRRVRELLQAHGQSHLSQNRAALINVWRPIRGPVQDLPLAVCDARSVSPPDFVETDIDHFAEEDTSRPRHTGQIYSVRHNPEHRWFYVSNMQPDEVLLFKGYDSLADGIARFTPHTGFSNPECPTEFVPRESIEARTIAVYPRLYAKS